MKKEITPELIARVALVIIVVIFAGRYGVHKYQEHQRAEELYHRESMNLTFRMSLCGMQLTYTIWFATHRRRTRK